jgi:hypothetical protein
VASVPFPYAPQQQPLRQALDTELAIEAFVGAVLPRRIAQRRRDFGLRNPFVDPATDDRSERMNSGAAYTLTSRERTSTTRLDQLIRPRRWPGTPACYLSITVWDLTY